MKDIKDKALSLICLNFEALKKLIREKYPIEMFINKQEDRLILEELINWYTKYNTKPNLPNIYIEMEKTNVSRAAIFKIRIAFLKAVKADMDEFDYLIDSLKLHWAKENTVNTIKTSFLQKADNINSTEEFHKIIKSLTGDLEKTSFRIKNNKEGDYSFTTLKIDENIKRINDKDLSNIKRFKIGHKPLDDAANGFMYGEILTIVGNSNQGKSMLVANAAYNLWLQGHNVLLFTAEMQPWVFDERIISRASSVPYSNINNGKGYLTSEDKDALEVARKFIKKQNEQNNIIVKYLYQGDNLTTIKGYFEDLEKNYNFVPDVLIVDSLEKISPYLKKFTGNSSDWLDKEQIMLEFHDFAAEFKDKRGLFIINTHQAKIGELQKEFKDIDLSSLGRSKTVADNSDVCFYIRYDSDLSRMNVKVVKARNFSADLSYNLSCDFSRAMVTNIENETIGA